MTELDITENLGLLGDHHAKNHRKYPFLPGSGRSNPLNCLLSLGHITFLSPFSMLWLTSIKPIGVFIVVAWIEYPTFVF